MAEHLTPEDTGERRAPREGRRELRTSLLSLAALVPLALAVGAVATTSPPQAQTVEHASTQSQPGPSTRWCPGPLQLPDAALEAGPDSDLAVTPPSPEIAQRTVSVEPASSLLFGRVSASQTLQEDDGSVRSPSIAVQDADGAVIAEDPVSQDLGAAVLETTSVDGAPHVTTAASEGGRPVADTVQSTVTATGDYRSLSATRCGEPVTDAGFLGVSTARGDSSVLVLRNPTDRPATASVQLWTQEGPASMEGRSQVVVAPGTEERVLLESIAPGQDALGVDVSVLGAPLSLFVQTTERDGLTPGGAELLAPLPAAGTELMMPGVETSGAPAELVLANPHGSDTVASVEVIGADGPVEAAALEAVEIPAGTVVSTALEGLPDGAHTVIVRAEDPVSAVTRSEAVGADLPGDTIGAPVDFTLVSPAPAIGSHAMSALPLNGVAGRLTLIGTADSAVTVIPIGADGSAGEPVSADVSAQATVSLTSDQLTVGDGPAAAVAVVPEVPGVVHASWTQRETDGTDAVLLSSLPVLPAQGGQDPVTVRLAH